MKRKAEPVLHQFIAEYHQGLNELAGHGTAIEQAQKALYEDLMAALPERWPKNINAYSEPEREYFNDAIDQMEQAIRSYFGRGE